ncbi:hypothetical protein MRX96_005613 [Rhipicephalus microplus]
MPCPCPTYYSPAAFHSSFPCFLLKPHEGLGLTRPHTVPCLVAHGMTLKTTRDDGAKELHQARSERFLVQRAAREDSQEKGRHEVAGRQDRSSKKRYMPRKEEM